MVDSEDAGFMAQAIALAKKGLYTTDPNPRVGAVIVSDGRVVGQGWHCRAGEPHAEIHALRRAGPQARGATAYVTLEPCCHHGRTPPCAHALIEAGVSRVVVGTLDPDPRVSGGGCEVLRASGLEVDVGALEEEASGLNPGFNLRHRIGRPLIRCKMGMTLDGRIATATGQSQWITSADARLDVHLLRARSSVIMTGIGTVIADNPSLTVRLPDQRRPKELLAPDRVVIDSRLRMPRESRMLRLPGRTMIFHGAIADQREELGSRPNVSLHEVSVDGGDRVDLYSVMKILAEKEVNEVLVEAGPALSGALLEAGLVDELWLYLAPSLLGNQAIGALSLPGIDRLEQAYALKIHSVRMIGEDIRIIAGKRVES